MSGATYRARARSRHRIRTAPTLTAPKASPFSSKTLSSPVTSKLVARASGAVARSKGMTEVAKAAGVSREHLYRALSSEGNPEFATVIKVLDALGLKLIAVPKAKRPPRRLRHRPLRTGSPSTCASS